MMTKMWNKFLVFLTHVTDVLAEQLERGAEMFLVGEDFGRIHDKDHAVNLVVQVGPLHVAHSL